MSFVYDSNNTVDNERRKFQPDHNGDVAVNVKGQVSLDPDSLIELENITVNIDNEVEIKNDVDNPIPVEIANQGQLVPTITNKLRIRSNIGDINLPGGGAYVTLYSRSGTGLFFGFQAEFDGAKVFIKLTVDGGQVFELVLDDIRQFQFNDTTTGRVQAGAFLTTIGNVLDFSSRYAIPYESEIIIEAKSADASARKNKKWMSIHTEDT